MQSFWVLLAYWQWLDFLVHDQVLAAEPLRVAVSVWLETQWQHFGSPFQQKVWQEINLLNVGETKSYGHIAMLIKNPRSYRAVANACGDNPWPFIVPCHRVVATGFVPQSWRNLGGYGLGSRLKRALLTQEFAVH